MNSTTAPQSAGLSLPRHAPAAARTTLQLLQRLRHGSLTLQLPDGTVQRFGGGAIRNRGGARSTFTVRKVSFGIGHRYPARLNCVKLAGDLTACSIVCSRPNSNYANSNYNNNK